MAEPKTNPPSSGFGRLAEIERELAEKKPAVRQPPKTGEGGTDRKR